MMLDDADARTGAAGPQPSDRIPRARASRAGLFSTGDGRAPSPVLL